MEIQTYYMANAFIIELKGELDKFCHLNELKKAIVDGANSQAVFIDLKNVTLISSGFVNFLFSLKKENPELSKKIRLIIVNGHVQDLLDVTKISELYPVYQDEFAAAAAQTAVQKVS